MPWSDLFTTITILKNNNNNKNLKTFSCDHDRYTKEFLAQIGKRVVYTKIFVGYKRDDNFLLIHNIQYNM